MIKCGFRKKNADLVREHEDECEIDFRRLKEKNCRTILINAETT